MSDDKKTYRTITEQELHTYLSGKLSPSRAHDLERQALHSDMEGDALEGWEAHDMDVLMYDMDTLRKKLESRSSRKIPVWLSIAAALVLFIGVGYLFRFFTDEIKSDKPIAQSIEETEKSESTLEKKEEVESRRPTTITQAPAREEPHKKVSKPKVTRPSKLAQDQEVIAMNEVADSRISAVEDEIVLVESLEVDEMAPSAIPEKVPELAKKAKIVAKKEELNTRSRINATGAVSRSASAPMVDRNSRTIFGVVTDDNDDPLPGVSVVVKGTQLGTVTDVDGLFELELQGEKPTLQIHIIGFASAERVITNEQTIKVQLNQDLMALEEVVVTGYDAERNANETFVNSYEKAKPSIGWDNLAQYIKKNKQMPKEAQSRNISGTVKLKFTISATGNITNIEVKKSLGYGCDEEAIRLIKNSGSWVSAKQNEQAVESTQTYRINFP